MSTFQNRTGHKLILETPEHIKFELAAGATFTGNNYYKRFATGDYAVLTTVSDDGSEYNGQGYESGAVARQSILTVTAPSAYAANEVDVETLVGGPAHYVQVETSAAVDMRFNDDANGTVRLGANDVQIFNTGDILVSKIAFDNTFSGASTATVTVTVVGKPTTSALPS